RDFRSFVHRIFAAGMALLAVEALFTGLSLQAATADRVLFWQQLRWLTTSLLPGTWLVFALSFGREHYWTSLAKWKWGILAVFAVNLGLASTVYSYFFQALPVFSQDFGWVIKLAWPGYAFQVAVILNTVLIVAILEQLLRASRGRLRWQVKFLLLGVGGLFAARIYTGSQAMLFHTIDLQLEFVNAAALLATCLLIMVSFARARVLPVDLYLSHRMLLNSLTVLVVGVYFLAVGVLAKVVSYVGEGFRFPLITFLVFSSLLGLAVLLLSDRMKLRMKRFVSIHFQRPQYDYRHIWTDFNRRTATLLETEDLCNAVVRMISETFDTLAVSIWLKGDRRTEMKLCGSTVSYQTETGSLQSFVHPLLKLMNSMDSDSPPIDLQDTEEVWLEAFRAHYPEFIEEARIRYCVPLAVGGESVGLLTLGDRVKAVPLTFEELDLLKTLANQLAGSLLNIKRAEELRQARELEAFQTMAAFFVHDLKNLASSLSIMLQNLPVHYDNPEFREDALKTIAKSVARIDSMCTRLSLLREKLELAPVKTDLNQLVSTVLKEVKQTPGVQLTTEYADLPQVYIDPQQMRKVISNLILNAFEAMPDGGEIRVSTSRLDSWAVISVSDNGCGMSRDFMEQSLFRPFRTSKKQGLGIGLFQSKMIVEAHRGQLEVESQEGKGSTFRVLLPMDSGVRGWEASGFRLR
ncbi:MAG: PEP-CTERM system histidine kinase PrsK, partial [Deltaproteobacteria bacterium]|nr:PEP-CTERM system histidine kinase PrsK [Deltaproteobacteria bacterium]